MTQIRKRLSGPEKIAIVKRYLVERAPISDLCGECGLQPSQIYRWQAAIFEHGADAYDLKRAVAPRRPSRPRMPGSPDSKRSSPRRTPRSPRRTRLSPNSWRRTSSRKSQCRNRWAPSKKGKGFVQPLKAHEHWHIDISYLTVEEARRVVGDFVTHYNEVRLHSALGYVTPHDKLAGRDAEIFASRDSKLKAARAKRLSAKSRAAEQDNSHTVLM